MATTVDARPKEGKEKKSQVRNKKYKVDIFADNSSGSLEFYIQPGDEDTRQHMRGKRLDFPYGTAWYDIEYKLDDNDSTVKVKFKQPGGICVQTGLGCPGKNSGIHANGQISVTDNTKDKKLVIENKNQNPPAAFSYNLFFTDMTGNDIGNLDPIYNNGGGGHT